MAILNRHSGQLSGAKGVQDLYLKFIDGDKPSLNLDDWNFE